VSAICVATIAAAQTKTFDIPAEDAAKAIPEFGRQAGVLISAPVSQLHGVKTHAVHGALDRRAALEILLTGTGLAVALDTGSAIILHRADTGAVGSPSGPEPTVATNADAATDIIVTGTRIRGAGPIGSEVIELKRDAITAQGYSTLADAVRTLPQQVNAGPNEQTSAFGTAGATQYASANSTGGTAINLRGLGANSTLTLLDGHRLTTSGTAGNYYDISNIPVVAIDRIEILADGASAVYGSDAVGGVVNIVLRKDFSGAETSADYGFANGFWRTSVNQVVGAKWDSGHAILTYQHLQQSDLSAGSRSYIRSDLRPFGGTDQRSLYYGQPGTISVGGKTYAIPAGQNGVGLSSSSLVAGTSNAFDPYPYYDIEPSKRQDAFLAVVSQNITDNLEFFAQGMGSFRHTRQQLTPARSVLTVPRSNAYFVSPSPTATSESVYYYFTNELGSQRYVSYQQDYGGTGGFRLKLPHDWVTDVSGTYSREHLVEDALGQVNSYYLNAALASSNPATAFDPFGDGSANSASVINAITGHTHYNYSTVSEGVNGQADGPLFHLPAGDVRVALGAEWRRESVAQNQLLYTYTASPIVPAGLVNLSRQVTAGFGELIVPVISPAMGFGPVRRFSLSAAVRTESYSDFGQTTNPRFGAELELPAGLTLRGSYDTSFQAPLLIQRIQSIYSGESATVSDPRSPTGQSLVLLRIGNDPNLQPETAKEWSAGGTWAPPGIKGLKIDASYFHIDFSNRVGAPSNYAVMLQQESIYSSLITRNPTAAQVAAVQNVSSFLGTPVNPASVAAILDIRSRNEARQLTDGLDMSVRWTHAAFGGQFNASFSGTRLFNDKIAVNPSAPLIQFVDNAFYPTSWKTRSSLGWEGHGFGLSTYLNWQNGYKYVTATGAIPIHSYTTLDLAMNVDLSKLGSRYLKGTKLTISVQNAANARPPFINVPGGYDSINASAMGRYVGLHISKDW
jgi:outer membrane receptor protein involved in Fe transport